ncbi:MAG: glycosyltransferase family 2 protein [Candidatus Methanofastidiosum sp.]|nr:glycosyltransferase family 2 protein [Methanofastidiosum sp.]
MKEKDIYPKVSIIILNWNGWKDTIECLESLYGIYYPNYDVILVDNGSEDNSIIKIKKYCQGEIEVDSEYFDYDPSNKPIKIIKHNIDSQLPVLENETNFYTFPNRKHQPTKNHHHTKLILVQNEKNYGFTKGNNIGIKYAIKYLDPKYVLLLNNDTVVAKDFLDELVNVGEKNENVGFLGPKIYFYDFKGQKNIIQYAGSKQNLWFFNPKIIGIFEVDHGQYDQVKSFEYVHGSCLLAKVGMIKEIGLLDEDFFSYREENDWGIRGIKKGWKSLYVPAAKIWHKGGKSSGGTLNPLTIFYMTRNDFILMKKHGNILQLIMFFIYFFAYKFWFFTGLYLIRYKNIKAFNGFLNGTKKGVFW